MSDVDIWDEINDWAVRLVTMIATWELANQTDRDHVADWAAEHAAEYARQMLSDAADYKVVDSNVITLADAALGLSPLYPNTSVEAAVQSAAGIARKFEAIEAAKAE
jgi:hypothetical protein